MVEGECGDEAICNQPVSYTHLLQEFNEQTASLATVLMEMGKLV